MARLQLLEDVAWDGTPIPGERTHALLRALAEAGHRGLSETALVEEIWGEDVPANPTKALQVVVSRARAATCPEAIERTARGYRLALTTTDVDVWALRPEGLRLAGAGDYAAALPLLERIPDRTDEVTAALLRSVAAVHGVPAALERYESYRSHLADALGVDPSPALRALHEELLARDRPVRSGVRFDADELIGRDADLAALRSLVGSHRVVSIVGAGGLGKTRLAHLMARLAEQPVVHFVELAGVTSPEGVAVEVADALGVREPATGQPLSMRRADLLTRVVDAVGTVPGLLVLDNCEHVVEAVADLVSLLVSRTPALTVLTTTRIPLGLAAERVYQLPELSTEDAVALFVERATSARPGVHLDPDEVRGLVTRLDGLPLAVELAAAKVRAMSVAEIARRLDNRFALLRGGSRDAPERHQTLLAVIDWSWNLLVEEERVALRRLSVFRDGFSLDGATALLGYDAVEVLDSLAQQSLVVVREDGAVRYRLLETVREFGRMQLVDAGDDAEAEKRLRTWATGLAAYGWERLYTPDQVRTMALLRPEEGNLVGVLRGALAARDLPTVAIVFAALSGFWTVEGTHVKVINLAAQVEELLSTEPTPPELVDEVRSGLAVAVANGMIFRGLARGPGLDRLRELGPGEDPRVAPTVHVLLEGGPIGLLEGIDRMQRLGESDDPRVARLALMWLAHGYENDGDLPRARTAAARALALSDDREGPWMRAQLTSQLCGFALHAGDFPAAAAYAEQAMPILAALGAEEDYTQARTVLALVALHSGRYDDADRLFAEVETEEGSQSIFGSALFLLCGRAELMLARGDVDAGLDAYADAVRLMRERGIPGLDLPVGFEPWVMFPQTALVVASARYGRRVEADRVELLGRAREMVGGAGLVDVPILGSAFFGLAAWELCFGDGRPAAELLAYAERFAFSRMLPGFDWEWALDRAGAERVDAARAVLGERRPSELREEIGDLLAQL